MRALLKFLDIIKDYLDEKLKSNSKENLIHVNKGCLDDFFCF